MIAAVIVLGLGLESARAQLLYPEDLAQRLLDVAGIHEASGIKARLRKVAKSAPPLFHLTEEAFSAIPPAADRMPIRSASTPKQWTLPPFTDIVPPPMGINPDELGSWEKPVTEGGVPGLPGSSEGFKQSEGRGGRQDITPLGFPELGLEAPKVYSAEFRPRVVAPGDEIVYRTKELEPPFSLRRYFGADDNEFVQIALFGGTTSWKAEEPYRAMKEVALKQEAIKGIGAEAFLTRVIVYKPLPEENVSSDVEGPPLPTIPPFPGIKPQDQARPDLLNSATAVALTAPSFQELPVKDLEGKTVKLPSEPKKYYPKDGVVLQSLWVLVAYFPDKALTMTLAVEERVGTVQDLIDLAMLAQKRMKEEASPRRV